ncbi:uncharacterized protein LOC141637445 [Silene latifolia]|uniref:uncharacterized protein LOC141637445 n=1 Tax=Silene latifolia TaxID=37657 RepID=UPI003D770AAD
MSCGTKRNAVWEQVLDDAKCCKYATRTLSGGASLWYKSLKARRARAGKEKLSSWDSLKRKLHKRYVPATYRLTTYRKIANLNQGRLRVSEYIDEFDNLTLMREVEESEELKMVEAQGKAKLPTIYGESSRNWRNEGGSEGSPASNVGEPKSAATPSSAARAPDSKETSLSKVRCLKCPGFGHYQSACPNERLNTLRDTVAYRDELFDEEERLGDVFNFEEREKDESIEPLSDDDQIKDVIEDDIFANLDEPHTRELEEVYDETHMEESYHTSYDDATQDNPNLVPISDEEIKDVFSEELPAGLPPIRGIEHQIDLLPRAPLPNKAAYRCNPMETKELQIEELMERGYVRESISPCVVPTLLVPKKDGTWRIRTEEEHFIHLREVFDILRGQKLYGEKEKWSLWVKSVIFLDYMDYYEHDPDFGETFEICKSGTHDEFIIPDGFLFKGNRLYVPKLPTRELLIREAHEGGLGGHFGINKTVDILKEHFHWPQLQRVMQDVIRRWEPYQVKELYQSPIDKYIDEKLHGGNSNFLLRSIFMVAHDDLVVSSNHYLDVGRIVHKRWWEGNHKKVKASKDGTKWF